MDFPQLSLKDSDRLKAPSIVSWMLILSHPPEKIPELVEQIINGKAEFVVGSRFVKGGSAEHFNWYRKLNAWVSKMLARPFTKVKDPMAGFFAFDAKILTPQILNVLNPLGFKIGP